MVKDGYKQTEGRTTLEEWTKVTASGQKLAQRLGAATTNKSGLGLLLLATAENGVEKKLMVSRFPAGPGIIAERSSESLKVELIEEVFLKSSHFYKAVVYYGKSFDSDFWFGYAVDKQINHLAKDIANYWIKDFLLSDFKTTSKAGTKRLALALKDAASYTDDLLIKHEITAAATLAKNFDGTVTTINEFCQHFNFSDETRKVIIDKVKKQQLTADRFEFDKTEFTKHLSYRSLKLDNGAILTAFVQEFDECFQKKKVENSSSEYIITTRGKIVDEQLRQTR